VTGSFLGEPPVTPPVQALFDDDLKDDGYVWNVTRLWAHQPETVTSLFGLMSQAFRPSGLSFRQRGILVVATASALGDEQIFAITAFVALRLAFSTINDALGAQPDGALARALPPEVRQAVTYGRPVAT
jgi:hypothetical protein